MNSIEQQHINNIFNSDSEGKTMEDFFNNLQIALGGVASISELKSSFKNEYPDETDWSF